jgi:hypothetical protein
VDIVENTNCCKEHGGPCTQWTLAEESQGKVTEHAELPRLEEEAAGEGDEDGKIEASSISNRRGQRSRLRRERGREMEEETMQRPRTGEGEGEGEE